MKWCLKSKNYPLCNVESGSGYDFKQTQLLVLVLNWEKSAHQQMFDFESKPTSIAQLGSVRHKKGIKAKRTHIDFCKK